MTRRFEQGDPNRLRLSTKAVDNFVDSCPAAYPARA
jgi:hypothetical protein